MSARQRHTYLHASLTYEGHEFQRFKLPKGFENGSSADAELLRQFLLSKDNASSSSPEMIASSRTDAVSSAFVAGLGPV